MFVKMQREQCPLLVTPVGGLDSELIILLIYYTSLARWYYYTLKSYYFAP